MEASSPKTNPFQLKSAFYLFSPSIKALGTNFWTFLALILFVPAYVIVCTCLAAVAGLWLENGQSTVIDVISVSLAILAVGGGIYVSVLSGAAIVFVQLASVKNHVIGVKEALLRSQPFFWRWFGLQIVRSLIFIGALLLLIVPFFFALRRYILADYYLFEYNLTIRQALKMSAEQSKQFSPAIWGLIGVQLLVNVAPVMGQALTILYFCAPAERFREITHTVDQLNKHHAHVSQTPQQEPAQTTTD